MKTIWVGTISAIALNLSTLSLSTLSLAAPASAADLAAQPYTKAPPPMVAPMYDWSGFYVGINGGGGSARNCWDLVTDADGAPVHPADRQGCHNATGGTVGGQIGYRWQTSNYVFGVEGQGNWADFTGSNASLSSILPFNTDTNRSRMDSFGLITGQAGYAWNNVLAYVKGGAAVVGNRFDRLDPTGALISSANETRWGGTVGAGLEVGFASNWSVGVEYNHIFLPDRNIAFAAPGSVFDGTDRIRQDVDMGLVRFNYRWGDPLIGRY